MKKQFMLLTATLALTPAIFAVGPTRPALPKVQCEVSYSVDSTMSVQNFISAKDSVLLTQSFPFPKPFSGLGVTSPLVQKYVKTIGFDYSISSITPVESRDNVMLNVRANITDKEKSSSLNGTMVLVPNKVTETGFSGLDVKETTTHTGQLASTSSNGDGTKTTVKVTCEILK